MICRHTLTLTLTCLYEVIFKAENAAVPKTSEIGCCFISDFHKYSDSVTQ